MYLTLEYLKSTNSYLVCQAKFSNWIIAGVLKTKLKLIWPNVPQNTSSYITFHTDKLNLKRCTQHTVHVELACESVANLRLSVQVT